MKGLDYIHTIYCIGRFYRMYKQTMGFARGMGTGIIAGVAIAAMGSKMMRENRGMKKKANKTMRTIGELMDTMQVMFH
jgi:hypothetical protein